MTRLEFEEILAQLNIHLDELQLNQFDRYYELLVEWNSFMNLTAITEYDEVLVKHFADCLAIESIREKYFSSFGKFCETKMIDVGTGAGFPGLPLKIFYPEVKMCLMDSLNKRVKFLNEVISQLELNGIDAVHFRAEDAAKKEEYREQFDIGISRAVANLSTLSEYVMPFLQVGGYFVAYKSGQIEEELEQAKKAISIFGGKIIAVEHLTLPNTDIERSFVIIQKTKSTPKKYPRKAGLPSKEPIMD